MTDVPRPILLCADDYGLAPGVSAAILELLQAGRLSVTGCMTVSPFWSEHGAWLKASVPPQAVGLHLTLTDHVPLGPMPNLRRRAGLAEDGPSPPRLPPLGVLLRLALTGQLRRPEIVAEIAAEIGRQCAVFTAVTGHPPAFIDGHQHVHLFPGISGLVLDAVAALPRGTWVRDCRESLPAILRRGVAVPKAAFLSLLGWTAGQRATKRGLAGNCGFRGVHDFSGRQPFAMLLDRFLGPGGNQEPGLPPLIMCHPGIPDAALRQADPVCEPRRDEYDTLVGPLLPQLLERHGVRLVRAGVGL